MKISFYAKDTSMKIMLLGFPNSGKTLFLKSVYKFNYNIGKNGFIVQEKKHEEIGQMQKIYNELIASAYRMPDCWNTGLVLKKDRNECLSINVTDIEGNAIEPGSKNKAAKNIKTHHYDSFVISIKSPSNKTEQDEASIQLSQCLSFISNTLENRKGIPVILLLNQIDKLPGAKGIENKFKEKVFQEKWEVISIGHIGKIIAPVISPIVCTEFNYTIINQFFRFLKNDKHDIPHKVFFCTNVGFDKNTNGDLFPYGTKAAFLWVIYASLKSNKRKYENIDSVSLADKLLEDIQAIYRSGMAYFDDNHPHEIWHSQYISYLYDRKIWNE